MLLKLAVSGVGLAATASVATLVRVSSLPASSVKSTRTWMVCSSSASVRVWLAPVAQHASAIDTSDRIKDHRERQECLEDAAADARAILSQRRAVLDDVNTIAAYAQNMSEFLNESELTERRAFIETFVKEIVVMPGDALMHYAIPMPDDSRIPGRNAEVMALTGSVLSTCQ